MTLNALLNFSINSSTVKYDRLEPLGMHQHCESFYSLCLTNMCVYDLIYVLQLQCVPSFIEDRLKLYEALKKEHDALLAYRAANQSKSIKITLLDGETVEGESWRTTPYQLAEGIR